MCVDINKIKECDAYDKLFEVLSTLKNKKIKQYLHRKIKDMLETPDFEQDYWSRTAKCIYKIGRDSIRILKWLAYYGRSYFKKIKYYDLKGPILKYLNEIS